MPLVAGDPLEQHIVELALGYDNVSSEWNGTGVLVQRHTWTADRDKKSRTPWPEGRNPAECSTLPGIMSIQSAFKAPVNDETPPRWRTMALFSARPMDPPWNSTGSSPRRSAICARIQPAAMASGVGVVMQKD